MEQRRVPWLMATFAAACWAVAHVVVHAGRGWPMNVLGEWDLLLTALAIAGGEAPDAALGTLHGNELGSWLVAALVAIPIRAGVDPVAAGKGVALAFGAASAATVAWLAAFLARESIRGAVIAGAAAALLVALAWPGLHFELQGVNGRTPESLLFQLTAVALVVRLAPDASVGSLRRTGVAVGVALSLGWLMSPVVLWTAAVAGFVLVWVVAGPRQRGSRAVEAVVTLGLGFVAPLIAFAVIVPGGFEGLGLFLDEQFGGGLGVTPASADRLGPAVLARVAGALEGGAHNPQLSLRPVGLAAIGWVLVLGLAVAVIRATLRRDWRDPSARGAVIALSWLAPLAVLPLDKWFYPLAYRYWVLLLALGIAVVPAALVGLGRAGQAAAAILAALTVLFAPTLPRSIIAPSAGRAEALVSSGAHRMNPRPDRHRHAAFEALFPHVAREDQPALAEGYGLALGGDMAVDVLDQRHEAGPWQTIRPALSGFVRTQFLVGVGCGVTAIGAVPQEVVDVLSSASLADQPALFNGLARCGGPVLAVGALPVDGRPITSTVASPAALMPPRWTGGPVEAAP